jgi:hypothetical protein
MIGTRISSYEITASLGAGGMGEVFRARDARLKREVAIKVLPKAFASNPDRLRRFAQESQTLAALNHPNILTIHDTGLHDGAPFLVSELLEGQTLRELLRGTVASLPLRKTADYALQMAQGLAAAHSKGIIHRDLKPENLFVTKDGRVKILDFGLAKLQVRDLASEMSNLKSTPDPAAPTVLQTTRPGLVLGTPAYMSPEQVRGQPADHRSDIFAFGCVLYEMLTGTGAFRRDSPVESMNAVLKEETPGLAGTHAGIPLAVDRVVRRCLEKEPERRFQSASDLAFALEGTDSTVLGPGLQLAAPQHGVNLRRALPWVVAVLGLAAWPAAQFFHKPAAKSMALSRPSAPVRKFELQLDPPDMPRGEGGVIPAISPDGRKIAYATSDGLWMRRLDRVAAPVQLVEGKKIARPFWSPASTDVGYFQEHKLVRVSLEGGGAITIASVPDHLVMGAEGGAWLPEVWTADFPSLSNRVMVSRGGGRSPVWARDGRELFYLASDERSLMAARMEPGQLRFGEPTKVLELPKSVFTYDPITEFYDVAADGQRFLMLQQINESAATNRANVLLVENWFEEYRSR